MEEGCQKKFYIYLLNQIFYIVQIIYGLGQNIHINIGSDLLYKNTNCQFDIWIIYLYLYYSKYKLIEFIYEQKEKIFIYLKEIQKIKNYAK